MAPAVVRLDLHATQADVCTNNVTVWQRDGRTWDNLFPQKWRGAYKEYDYGHLTNGTCREFH